MQTTNTKMAIGTRLEPVPNAAPELNPARPVQSVMSESTRDICWIHEHGLTQKLSTPIRCF